MPKTIRSRATLLSASAALLFAFGATAAYAQDADMAEKDAVMDAAEATMEAAEDTMDAAEALQTDEMNAAGEMNPPDTTAEPVMVDKTMMMEGKTMDHKSMHDGKMHDGQMHDGTMHTKSGMMADPVMEPAPASAAPVGCPSGTTAQADGTCMITGDWSGN